MNNEAEALPVCPFCGDLASLHGHGGVFRDGGGIGYRVECEGACHAMTCYWHTEQEAIDAWSLRKGCAEVAREAVDVCKTLPPTSRLELLKHVDVSICKAFGASDPR